MHIVNISAVWIYSCDKVVFIVGGGGGGVVELAAMLICRSLSCSESPCQSYDACRLDGHLSFSLVCTSSLLFVLLDS